VNDGDGSQNGTLPEQIQRQNAALQALIETIDRLIAGSRVLLLKLQGGNTEEPPSETKP
jgi:hypothetical protein